MNAHAGTPPSHVLGLPIRSRTRIYISYLFPSTLELFFYICQIVADCAVSYEHFHNHQSDFGWATLILILIPPILTFIFVLSSKAQWDNPKHADHKHFVGYQLLQMFLFPFFAIYRFMVRVFWAIEALFHDDDDIERISCLAKTEECSTCELYHLIQAYAQSAPQIILQLYHMLTQDLFRNFQTTNAQALSLVFSAIDLAAITTTYQRFESQKQVGRNYLWAPPQEIEEQRKILAQNECLRNECELKTRDSQRTIASFPESDKIMENFKLRTGIADKNDDAVETQQINLNSESKIHEVLVHGMDEVDNDAFDTNERDETTVLIHQTNNDILTSPHHNATDDDKIRTSPKLKLHSIREEMRHLEDIEIIDTVPDSPAPLPPPSAIGRDRHSDTPQLRTQISSGNSENTSNTTHNKRSSKTFSQLETFKDMFIVNTQLYIKEHVPHPPKMLISRIDEPEKDQTVARSSLIPTPDTPLTPKDVVDFFLPRPTKIVNGIQQDDFAGKTIAFFGWIAFTTMRMLSLTTFCVFFPNAFFILISVHYLVMLGAIYFETRFEGKLNRTLFYMLLAYVYIYVLLEFRIKFKRIRLWFVGYFVITMGENIGMTMIWYAREEFENWWFGFIFEGIIYSGILFVATLLVYYFILKPKDVTLIIEDNTDDNNKVTS